MCDSLLSATLAARRETEAGAALEALRGTAGAIRAGADGFSAPLDMELLVICSRVAALAWCRSDATSEVDMTETTAPDAAADCRLSSVPLKVANGVDISCTDVCSSCSSDGSDGAGTCAIPRALGR